MGKVLFSVGILWSIGVICSCNQRNAHSGARKLDKTITTVNDSLFVLQKHWSKTMAYAVSSGNYSKLKPARVKFGRYLEYATATVMSLQDTAGSETLKKCELELIALEKKNIPTAFQPFEKLKFNTPMIEVSICIGKLNEAGNLEKKALDRLNSIQSDYEEKNGFKFAAQALKKHRGDTTASTP